MDNANPNLIDSSDCGKKVSVHASTCPHCGREVKFAEAKKYLNAIAIFLAILIALFILAALWMVFGYPLVNMR